jgi:hypothetical protein
MIAAALLLVVGGCSGDREIVLVADATDVQPYRMISLRSEAVLEGEITATLDGVDLEVVQMTPYQLVVAIPQTGPGSYVLSVVIGGRSAAPVALTVAASPPAPDDPLAAMEAIIEEIDVELASSEPDATGDVLAAVTNARAVLATTRQQLATLSMEELVTVWRFSVANRSEDAPYASAVLLPLGHWEPRALRFIYLGARVTATAALGTLVPGGFLPAAILIANDLTEMTSLAQDIIQDRPLRDSDVEIETGEPANGQGRLPREGGLHFISEQPYLLRFEATFRSLGSEDVEHPVSLVRDAARTFEEMAQVLDAAGDVTEGYPRLPQLGEPESERRTIPGAFITVGFDDDRVRLVTSTPSDKGLEVTFASVHPTPECHDFSFTAYYHDFDEAFAHETEVLADLDCISGCLDGTSMTFESPQCMELPYEGYELVGSVMSEFGGIEHCSSQVSHTVENLSIGGYCAPVTLYADGTAEAPGATAADYDPLTCRYTLARDPDLYVTTTITLERTTEGVVARFASIWEPGSDSGYVGMCTMTWSSI